MNASDSIVIIPTYNEKENIEKIIRAIFGLEKCFHILVIDDGSPDGTASIVKRLMANEFGDRLFIIERSGKLGLGTAYIAGFKWSIEHKYDYMLETPASCSINRRQKAVPIGFLSAAAFEKCSAAKLVKNLLVFTSCRTLSGLFPAFFDFAC